ncbi:hypothetical protein RUM44_010193 [Polyplax serrata]|uniref:Uncharacterized protein n=1 Tax=Polyplax serrata TaxID=468196 RepID=A0ABR1AUV9_POLSC
MAEILEKSDRRTWNNWNKLLSVLEPDVPFFFFLFNSTESERNFCGGRMSLASAGAEKWLLFREDFSLNLSFANILCNNPFVFEEETKNKNMKIEKKTHYTVPPSIYREQLHLR